MKCKEIGFGTYACAYNIYLPYKVESSYNGAKAFEIKQVSIDKCLLPEVLKLWEQGIKTTGCCCGHGDKSKAFIGVKEEYIDKMKELGYKVYENVCRPGDEDSFVPMTNLKYGIINKGFEG